MYSFGINSVVYKIKFNEMMRLNTNANFAKKFTSLGAGYVGTGRNVMGWAKTKC